jgi:hypothetical protein
MKPNRQVLIWERWHLDAPSGCWLWDGPTNRHGYGMTSRKTWGESLAHRAFYNHFVGPIPEGLHIDHLCRARMCVNPSHLEPVTQDENNRRMVLTITHCKHGHEFTPENTHIGPSGRRCRECSLRTSRAKMQRYRDGGLTTSGTPWVSRAWRGGSPWARWHLDVSTGCWRWDGPTDGRYGHVSPRWGGSGVVHRAFYEHFVGPVPEGWWLEHLCRVPLCVNPEHLKPITPSESIRRAIGARREQSASVV